MYFLVFPSYQNLLMLKDILLSYNKTENLKL